MSCPPHPLAPRPPYLREQPRPLSYYRLVQLPNQNFISYCAASPRRHPGHMPTLRSKPAAGGSKETKGTQTPSRIKDVSTDSLAKHDKYTKRRPVTATPQSREGSASRHQMKRSRSAYYDRAKSGFVYWPTEPKKLTHDLKRPLGSIGAVYGLGSGPRS